MKQNSAPTAKQNPKQTQSPALDPKQNSAGITEVMGMSPVASFQQARSGQPKPAHWLTLQRTVGNRATQNLIQRSTFFDKLGSKDDSGEKGSTNHPTLQYGSQGSAVSTLQNLLNLAGAIPQLVVDGIFGPKTHNAVQGFQAQNQLTPDGIVGDQTWKALDSVSGMPSEDMTANEGETLDNGTSNQTHNLTDSSEDGGLFSAIGQGISIINNISPQHSWTNVYNPDSENRIGQIFFDTAEDTAYGLDDIEAINKAGWIIGPYLRNTATKPVEFYFLGHADYRPYSGDNEKLAHQRALNIAADLNRAMTGGTNNPHENYIPYAIGMGVEKGSIGLPASDEALAPYRRVDIVTYHKFSEPNYEPTNPQEDPNPKPGKIVTHDQLPKSQNWEARILSKAKIGGNFLGAENMELEIRDIENRLGMRFVYFGYMPKAGLSASMKPTDWVPFTTDIPVRIMDFRGLAAHTIAPSLDGVVEKVVMRGPMFVGASGPAEFAFTSSILKSPNKLKISGSAGGISDVSFARTY